MTCYQEDIEEGRGGVRGWAGITGEGTSEQRWALPAESTELRDFHHLRHSVRHAEGTGSTGRTQRPGENAVSAGGEGNDSDKDGLWPRRFHSVQMLPPRTRAPAAPRRDAGNARLLHLTFARTMDGKKGAQESVKQSSPAGSGGRRPPGRELEVREAALGASVWATQCPPPGPCGAHVSALASVYQLPPSPRSFRAPWLLAAQNWGGRSASLGRGGGWGRIPKPPGSLHQRALCDLAPRCLRGVWSP